MTDEVNKEELLALTSEIVSSYLAHNSVETSEISSIIEDVYKTLSSVDGGSASSLGRPQPAVPISESVMPEYIVCLEDGKQLKMLKRHLKTAYNMSPEEYRERWGLPADYPMVAPEYAEKRSRLAKDIGLGTRGR